MRKYCSFYVLEKYFARGRKVLSFVRLRTKFVQFAIDHMDIHKLI